MITIKKILDQKKGEVYTISPKASVMTAVKVLTQFNVGALVVTTEDTPIGIISERDILRSTERHAERLNLLRVEEIMTKEVIIGVPQDDLTYVMAVMTKNRIRHLPILENKKLVGILSIGDVVRATMKEVQIENHLLHDYIEGKYPG